MQLLTALNNFRKSLTATFVTLALLVLAIWLLLDKCTPTRKDVVPVSVNIKHVMDSLEKDFAARHEADVVSTTRLIRERDSLQIQLNTISKALNKSSKTAVRLATEIELAKKEKDTSSYVSNCDSLSNEVVNQAGVIQQMEWYLAEVVKYNDSILSEKDKQYNDLQSLHSTTLNSFDFVSEQNLLLAKKVNQLQKKDGRKYSLAISAGYGVGLIGGPQPFVGITISRPIFKFKL